MGYVSIDSLNSAVQHLHQQIENATVKTSLFRGKRYSIGYQNLTLHQVLDKIEKLNLDFATNCKQLKKEYESFAKMHDSMQLLLKSYGRILSLAKVRQVKSHAPSNKIAKLFFKIFDWCFSLFSKRDRLVNQVAEHLANSDKLLLESMQRHVLQVAQKALSFSTRALKITEELANKTSLPRPVTKEQESERDNLVKELEQIQAVFKRAAEEVQPFYLLRPDIKEFKIK